MISSAKRRRRIPVWFRIGPYHVEQTEGGCWRIEDAHGRVLAELDTIEAARAFIDAIKIDEPVGGAS